MDYLRIYRAFIADRKQRELTLSGYVERHHIVPRCLGGGNEAENIIRLVAEDHFFAHLLLAKAHGGKLWAPIAFMVSGQRKDYRPIQSRRAYGWVARAMAKAMSGEGSHQFDWTVYHLEHIDGQKWAGLQSEMPALGISRSLANMLIKGRVGSARGWFFEGKYSPKMGRGARAGKNHFMADHRVHRFRHIDGSFFEGTQIEFREVSGVSQSGTTGLVNGSRTISKGWHLDGVTPKTSGRAGAYTRRAQHSVGRRIH